MDIFLPINFTPDRRQLKALRLSRNVDQKLLETEFSIAICRLTGDKWQSKTLFLAIFYPRSLIVKSVFDCQISGVNFKICFKRGFLSTQNICFG